MNENLLVSVIVPIYNAEKYLDKCIQSIAEQTYKRLEIILVDDGSTDNSPAICDSWIEKDSRVRVIHKKNGGVSTARNAGIANASGLFLSFVDSDDWILKDMISTLVDLQRKTGADVAGCCAHTVNAGETFVEQQLPNEVTTIYTFSKVLKDNFPDFSWSLCGKIYRAELFKNLPNNLPEHLVMSEDIMLNTFLYKNSEKIVLTNSKYYIYFRDGNSAISGELTERMISDCQIAYSTMLMSVDKNTSSYKYMLACKLQNDFFLLNSIVRNNKYFDQYDRLKNEILSNKSIVFEKDCANIFSRTQKMGVLLLRFSSKLYNKSILIRKRIRGY